MPTVQSNKRISASKYWFFTWNNYRPDWLQNFKLDLDGKCIKYVVEHEVGEEGTPHLQGKIHLKTKGRPIELFGIKEIQWRKSVKWKGVEYCTKDGTEEGVDIWFKGWRPVLAPKIYGWQQKVVDMMPEMKTRNIYWFWEPDEQLGKTDLCRYLILKKLAWGPVGGKGADMKYAIAQLEDKPEVILVNIPHASSGFVSYTALEEISDGIFFSGKYEAAPVIFNKPKLIVFANVEPDYSQMSNDRWQVYNIRSDLM